VPTKRKKAIASDGVFAAGAETETKKFQALKPKRKKKFKTETNTGTGEIKNVPLLDVGCNLISSG